MIQILDKSQQNKKEVIEKYWKSHNRVRLVIEWNFRFKIY